MTILEAAAQLRAQQTTSRRLTEACLARIAEFDPRVNSFITVTGEQALAQADAADRELAAGQDRGPLHGIPIALKDVYNTAGIRTTAGSLLFRDYVPETDSAVTEKLAAAGAVMVGKTNLHELAYGVTSSNPHFGPVRNPWDLHCVPGGSSGGSAAAVAARMCFMATGSDTGASIRVPAAFCNTVGLKPTYGRVSRRGILPLDFSLDHMGPITLTVRDAAACLQAMAGEDPLDDTSSPEPVDDYMPPTRVSLAGVRVGVPENFYFDGIDPAAQTTTRQMVQLAAGLGAQVEVIRVPDILAMNTAARVILLSRRRCAGDVRPGTVSRGDGLRERPAGATGVPRRVPGDLPPGGRAIHADESDGGAADWAEDGADRRRRRGLPAGDDAVCAGDQPAGLPCSVAAVRVRRAADAAGAADDRGAV